jgi:hypothetical protein
MLSSHALALLLANMLAVSAQSPSAQSTARPTGTVVQVVFPSFDDMGGNDASPGQLIGSVIGAAASTTTLAVFCASGTADEDCSVPSEGITFTQGPTTVAMSTEMPAQSDNPVAVKYGWECKLGGTTSVACTYIEDVSIVGSVDADLMTAYNGSSTVHSTTATTVTGTVAESLFVPVTITAGAEKLQAATASNTGAPSQSPTGAAPTASGPGANAASQVEVGGLIIAAGLLALLRL